MQNKAIIITIGDELLIGQVVDTNSSWLAEQLTRMGFSVVKKISIGDNSVAINHELNNGLNADLVLITGGLGPTKDDITKACLFKFFDSKGLMNSKVLQNVASFLAGRSVPMNELNERQAIVADNCIVISNEIGTAPGMWFEKKNSVFVAMPGVPFEMKQMFQNHLEPLLLKRFNNQVIVQKNILTTGIGESTLAKVIEEWEDALPENIKLAYLPSPGIVKLRLTVFENNQTNAEELLNIQTQKLHSLIAEYIWGYDNDTLEEIIGGLLKTKQKTVAVAESCTGGSIGSAITSVPGSSAWFKGGIIAYSNDIKTQYLNVAESILTKHGAVSAQVVELMAAEICRTFNSDYGIAVSGIAGPDGSTPDKPVGTVWIAISSPQGVSSHKFIFGEHRGRNILKATIAALNNLRISLQSIDKITK